MSKRFACWAGLVAVASLSLAGAAEAQPARNSIERTRAAVCAKADADGDSYRPFVCDPRCDCLSTSSIAAVTACSETAPGNFTANLSQPTGPCIDVCITNPDFGSHCASSPPGAPCTEDADCLAGQSCFGACYSPTCTDDADCNGAPSRCENSPPVSNCTSDSDCPDGRICVEPDPMGYCSELYCSQDSDCPDTDHVRLTLEDVAGPDSPTPVSCSDWAVPLATAATNTISSNDALECITQIEAAIGQSCTPFVP